MHRLILLLTLLLVSCANQQARNEGLVADPTAPPLESFENFEDAFGQAAQQSVIGTYVGKGSDADTVIYFDFDSAYLALDGRTALNDTIAKIKAELEKRKNENMIVRVEGHTDERGTDAYNLALGQRRANTVARYISLNGVPAARLQVVSYGETRPAAAGSGEIAWAENRRVEIKYTGR